LFGPTYHTVRGSEIPQTTSQAETSGPGTGSSSISSDSRSAARREPAAGLLTMDPALKRPARQINACPGRSDDGRNGADVVEQRFGAGGPLRIGHHQHAGGRETVDPTTERPRGVDRHGTSQHCERQRGGCNRPGPGILWVIMGEPILF